ncbi:GNAT family N-acetyltransferase [Psychromicrobium lacuslunae]|uniref:Acetyltransferase n=1 Tax=Psychromicrobium lacuslunae TaxID=1618207 RepID=A0A0D4C025_9MICC|nr:GNAT family N-acetyltransferase [Psychromicrobium lacuslunae]AJT42007.1 acetyltransferase [Psychromicrobium lacuslunae]
MPLEWSLRQSSPSDAEWIAELRAEVMYPDLQRLGLWDPVRVRQRFLNGFHPEHTWIIKVADRQAGSIALRPEAADQWLEHFYLATEFQGRGLGNAVLGTLLAEHRDHRPYRLNVLQGSAAKKLYQRHGFVLETEDDVDQFMISNQPPVN